MINICAIGPLRVSAALVKQWRIDERWLQDCHDYDTSQGGLIKWCLVQNPTGHDYGHHMSKAVANMMAKLLSLELKEKGIAVGIFHPGFNKKMTEKYKDDSSKEGAVDPSIGAKCVMHETGRLSMETSGKFINCEDGFEIPW